MPMSDKFYNSIYKKCVQLFNRYVMGCMTPYNYLAGICGVIPIIFAIFVAYLPESPRYLVSTGQQKEASNALCWLRSSDKKSPNKDVLQEIDEVDKTNQTMTDLWTDL